MTREAPRRSWEDLVKCVREDLVALGLQHKSIGKPLGVYHRDDVIRTFHSRVDSTWGRVID